MNSTPKKVIIALVMLVILVVIYFMLNKNDEEQANLVSTSEVSPTTPNNTEDAYVNQDFLSDLLNIKNIKLDDTIFSEPAFATLLDSTIVLTPDGNEGRPNPFAPIGVDVITVVSTPPATITPAKTPSTTSTTTPKTPSSTLPPKGPTVPVN